MGSIPGSGRYPGEGNDNPRQYSFLGNSMDRGACWAIVHGGRKKSDTTEHAHAHSPWLPPFTLHFYEFGCFRFLIKVKPCKLLINIKKIPHKSTVLIVMIVSQVNVYVHAQP